MAERKTRIYLAIPYTGMHTLSFNVSAFVAGQLLATGTYDVYSPITHSHPIAGAYPQTQQEELWLPLDESVIESWADEVWVVCLPGWQLSKGVAREIERARALDKPVHYIGEVQLVTYNDPVFLSRESEPFGSLVSHVCRLPDDFVDEAARVAREIDRTSKQKTDEENEG